MFLGSFTAQSAVRSYAATTVAGASVALPGIGSVIRIVNEGPNIAYVSIGVGAQVATLPTAVAVGTCTPILPGSDVTFSIPNTLTPLNISAICGTGTAVLDLQIGEGM